MLSVYRANRLELLAARLSEVAHAGRVRPFHACRVAVQHLGMGRWLSLQITGVTGVCMNLNFQLPAVFIWDLMRAALHEPTAAYRYTKQALCWRLLQAFDQLPGHEPAYAELKGHLQHAGPGARYELALNLAAVYDRYLVYRPDWIEGWEAGKGSHWQAHLWRELVAVEGEHWVRTARRFQEAVRAGRIAPLPEMACLFAVPTLSPGYLEILKSLSGPMDLHLFLLDPSREYWGDLESPTRIAKAVMEERPGADAMQVGNRLLAGSGRQGRDFLDAVHGLEPGHEEALHTYPGRADYLHCLQSDLLELGPGGPAPEAQDDLSVQVHACHGPMRELEVLHDRLLELFARRPHIGPADVVVMVPDMERYAPLVEAVFETARPRIPYEITDRMSHVNDPAAVALCTLLELPEHRFEAESILELLRWAPVRLRADITEQELPHLRRWLRRAGLRWGVDLDHRAALQLPAEATNTWRYALDRLLLGCALPEDQMRPFEGCLPSGDLEGEDIRLLGRLCGFFEGLVELRETLGRRPCLPLKDWRDLLKRVIQRFLHTPAEEVHRLTVRIQDWLDAAADTTQGVHLADLRAGLRRMLAAQAAGGRFPGTGVSFCRMVPMRSVPFAVVCLLGLDFDAYPRTFYPPSFDLSARKPRRGDRRRSDDDRYLFLEALLSARDCMYLSYTGRDPHDDSERPPSVMISELLAQLGAYYGVGDDADGIAGGARIHRHPLQPFSRKYFAGAEPGLYSYSFTALEICRAAHDKPVPSPAFVPASNPCAEPAGTLEDLEAFCRGGARYYLQRRLGIYAPRAIAYIENEESFVPMSRERVQLREELLAAELQGIPVAAAGLLASGALPHGHAGAAVWAQEQRTVRHFARSLRALGIQTQETTSVPFDLPLQQSCLVGSLPRLSTAGAVYLYPRRVYEAEYMVLWLRHLVLSACRPTGVTPQTHLSYLDKHGTPIHHSLSPVDDASAQLSTWLRWCNQGLAEPLPLLPRSSMAYVSAAQGADPMHKARAAWLGSPEFSGEQQDFYNRLAFRGRTLPLEDERFRVLATELLRPLQHALQEAG